ncbi:LacI family DNA-binding transcriptional regulator [Hamadaea sp. NPDC051192]|uniref:LacI family DNA-binding transcriptional regulator n=1 Tax=Hamadaea sp. NPDC051192 TaxID=3154940 RepID=UPI003426AD0D
MTGRPRQRDIARLAGVSQTAVSLILNGKTAEHGLTKETERKVLDAMRQLGYVPNVTAQALRGGRNGLIGVHTFEPLFPNKGTYYDEFMVGIEDQAIRAGQDLVLFTSVHQREGDQSIYRGGQNRLRIADGAVILGFNQHGEELARLAAEGFPFVFIGRRESAADLMPYITPDYTPAVGSMVDQAYQLGHRHAAYLGLPDRSEPRVERRDAFRTFCARTGIAITEETVAEPQALTSDWLSAVCSSGATVLFVESSYHLEELARLSAETRTRIPSRLSVVGLDSIDAAGNATHHWTHISVQRRAIGARAVEMLLEVIDGLRGVHDHEHYPCRLEHGATLVPPPRARVARPRSAGRRRSDTD